MKRKSPRSVKNKILMHAAVAEVRILQNTNPAFLQYGDALGRGTSIYIHLARGWSTSEGIHSVQADNVHKAFKELKRVVPCSCGACYDATDLRDIVRHITTTGSIITTEAESDELPTCVWSAP
jgi:hypothetical protein